MGVTRKVPARGSFCRRRGRSLRACPAGVAGGRNNRGAVRPRVSTAGAGS